MPIPGLNKNPQITLGKKLVIVGAADVVEDKLGSNFAKIPTTLDKTNDFSNLIKFIKSKITNADTIGNKNEISFLSF